MERKLLTVSSKGWLEGLKKVHVQNLVHCLELNKCSINVNYLYCQMVPKTQVTLSEMRRGKRLKFNFSNILLF